MFAIFAGEANLGKLNAAKMFMLLLIQKGTAAHRLSET